MDRMGVHFQRLAVLAEEETAWQSRPKTHYAVVHLHQQAALINPRFVHTYGSEGMVGVVCSIYEASQNGPFAAGVRRTILLKYRVGLVLKQGR